MKIVETDDFKKNLKKLPSEVKGLYKNQAAIFFKIGHRKDVYRK